MYIIFKNCTQQLNVTNDPLPVMVWIHGGAFYMGSGNGVTDMFGPGYLLDRDIVLVTLNYRLGPLGANLLMFPCFSYAMVPAAVCLIIYYSM